MPEPTTPATNTTTAPAADQRIVYDLEQQQIIDALILAQKRLRLTDERFAKEFLGGYSGSTWSRLRDGLYKVNKLPEIFAELRTYLRSTHHRLAVLAKKNAGTPFYDLPIFQSLFKAVSDCLQKPSQNRLIVFPAPTGAGKSRFITELSGRETTTVVTASRPWETSYFFAALDVCRALETTGTIGSAGEARIEMLLRLNQLKRVLAIDEGNYFGPKSIDMVKDILNETDSTVLLCCTPAHWDKMQRFWTSFDQLQRRVHVVLPLTTLAPSDVLPFVQAAGLNGQSESAAALIAAAANRFGHFDMVQRVIHRLSEAAPSHPTLDDVKSATEFVQTQLGRRK